MDCDLVKKQNKETLLVRKKIQIYKESEKELIIEWKSSKRNDIIADCLGYMFYNISEYENLDVFESSSSGKKKEIDEVKKK